MSVQQLPAESTIRQAATSAPQAAADKPAPPRWIAGPLYDTIFFVFPILFSAIFIGLISLFVSNKTFFEAAIWFIIVLGFAHGMGSFFFYFDKQNLAHYKKNFVKYFLVPPVLFFGTIALAGFEWYMAQESIGWPSFMIVPAIGFIYLFWHMTRQNIGFVSFYRHKYGITDPKERGIDNNLIYLNAFLLYAVGWYYGGMEFLPQARFEFLPIVFVGLAILYAFVAGRAIMARWKTLRQTSFTSWPHIGIIITAMLFPAPFIVFLLGFKDPFILHPFGYQIQIPGASFPLFGLIAHYVQYIALVSLIHMHKYPAAMPSAFSHDEGAASGSGELIFGRLPINGVYILLAFMILAAVALAVFQYVGTLNTDRGLLVALTLGAVFGVGVVHYYVDGLIWAFREEHVRKSILPYLKPLK